MVLRLRGGGGIRVIFRDYTGKVEKDTYIDPDMDFFSIIKQLAKTLDKAENEVRIFDSNGNEFPKSYA